MVRKSAAALMLLALVCDAVPAFAETSREAPPDAVEAPNLTAAKTPATVRAAGTLSPLAGDVDWSLPPVHLGAEMHANSRGFLLPALYVSLGGLQLFDAYSTS